jgi:tetratricopeptide (TPR) repeat protein
MSNYFWKLSLLSFFFSFFHICCSAKSKKINSLKDSISKYKSCRNNEKVLEFSNQIYTLLKRKKDTLGLEMAENQEVLGAALLRLKNFKEGKRRLESALSILSRIDTSRDKRKADIYYRLGYSHVKLFEFEEANNCYQQCLEIRKKFFGQISSPVQEVLEIMGIMFLKWSRFEDGEKILLKSLEVGQKLFGSEDTLLIDTYNNLGAIYISSGRYIESENVLLKCIDIIQKNKGLKNIQLYDPLNNLGNLKIYLKNYYEAKNIFERVLEISQYYYKNGNPEDVIVHNNLGALYLRQKNYGQARKYFHNANEVIPKINSNYQVEFSKAKSNLGILYLLEGRTKPAIQCFLESYKILKSILDSNHFEFFHLYYNLGVAYFRIGNFKVSDAYFQSAHSILELQPEENRMYHAEFSSRFGLLKWEMNELSQAERLFLKFHKINLELIHQYFPFFTEEEKEKYAEGQSVFWNDLKKFCVDRFGSQTLISISLLEHQLSVKGLLFGSTKKWREGIRSSNNPEVLSLFEKWQKTKEELNRGIFEKSFPIKTFNIDSLKREIQKLEKLLSQKSAYFSSIREKNFPSFKEIQSSLKPGEALVDILKYTEIDSNFYPLDSVPFDGPKKMKYVALVLKFGDKFPNLVKIENGNELESIGIREYRKKIQKGILDANSYGRFWEKIGRSIMGAKKVYFCPDGVFHKINPDTLWNPKSRKYLLEELDIRLITNGKDIIYGQKEGVLPSRNATLIGDPEISQLQQKSKFG